MLGFIIVFKIQKVLIPLIFDTYGGYADVTYKFLKTRADEAGGGGPRIAAKVGRLFRDRIAVALRTGHVRVLTALEQRTGTPDEPVPRKQCRQIFV